jgi:UPF0755 protein
MKRFGIFLFFLFIGVLGALGFIYFLGTPVSSKASIKDFVINRGDSLSNISERLETNGLIRSKYYFVFYTRLTRLSQKIQAGKFSLNPTQSTSEIAVSITEPASNDYWLKIGEGTRVEEFAPSVEFLSKAKALNGMLFPDSYLIPEQYSVDEILDVVNKNYLQKIAQAKVDATETSLSESEALILASLLEREARTLAVKQVVSGILLNRLKIGMALQVDATVQYARDSKVPRPKTYWLPLAKKDISIDSPFNTYKNPGLPPSPICNPGYDSIYAAYHPTPNDYIFYITDNNGVMHYAKTLNEHNANVAKYLK